MGAFSYDVTRQELARIIDAMPTEECRAMHLATHQGDLATAQRLLREAAATYYTSAPAAPAVIGATFRGGRRTRRTTLSNV